MFLTLNDNIFNKGFCKGHYLVTVDHGPRIRLPVATVHTFEEQEIELIFLFLDPSGPRLILCPDKCCEIYIQHAKRYFPVSVEIGKAYRKFICTMEPITLRKPYRIQVKAKFNEKIGIKAGDVVIIVGVGHWFEVWQKSDWEGGKDD